MAAEPGQGTTYPPLGHWSLRSRCFQLGLDPDLFFEDTAPPEAKAACRDCTVREECLAYAMENRPKGYWGGTTERERWRRGRDARRREAPSPPRGACPGCRSSQVIAAARAELECLACGARWPAV